MVDNMTYIDDLILRYPMLEASKTDIINAYELLKDCFENKGKLLICGNGGSSSDANHIVGELMKGFCLPRKVGCEFANKLKSINADEGTVLAEKLQGALPAIALDNHNALNTAYLNDVDGLLCYAQQIMGYGNEGDVLLGISTSGNSKNVMYAVTTAKAKGLKTILLTGKSGGRLKNEVDIAICVDETETYKIQELHLPVYHCLCLMLEKHFFGE